MRDIELRVPFEILTNEVMRCDAEFHTHIAHLTFVTLNRADGCRTGRKRYSLCLLFCTAYYSGSNARAPFLVPLCATCAAHRTMRRFRVLSCRGAFSRFAHERIRRIRRRGGETAKTASVQCSTRRRTKRQTRSSAALGDAAPQRRSRAFGREFSWYGPQGPAGQAANAQFQPTNQRFLAAMKNQG